MDNQDESKRIRAEVGKRIAHIRECMNMSQSKFAEFVDISENFLSMIENGNRGLSGETVAKISSITGYSADYILLGKTDSNIVSPDSREVMKKHLLELLKLLDE